MIYNENEKNKLYNFEDAITIIKNLKKKKFMESIDVSISIETNPKNKNINIKGYSCLPNDINKKYKIAIFSINDILIDEEKNKINILKENNIKELTKKNINFDIILTDITSLTKINSINKILNAKKIMPDIQYNTITSNFNETINKIKNNYIQYKSNKTNTINCKIGYLNLDTKKLKENLETLIIDIKKNKQKICKNIKIKNIYLSSTMSKSIKINTNSLNI